MRWNPFELFSKKEDDIPITSDERTSMKSDYHVRHLFGDKLTIRTVALELSLTDNNNNDDPHAVRVSS